MIRPPATKSLSWFERWVLRRRAKPKPAAIATASGVEANVHAFPMRCICCGAWLMGALTKHEADCDIRLIIEGLHRGGPPWFPEGV